MISVFNYFFSVNTCRCIDTEKMLIHVDALTSEQVDHPRQQLQSSHDEVKEKIFLTHFVADMCQEDLAVSLWLDISINYSGSCGPSFVPNASPDDWLLAMQ